MRKIYHILTTVSLLQAKLPRHIAFAFLMAILSAGCVSSNELAGVDNVWRDPSVAFADGVSTTDDVLKALGPPSQVIALGEKTVFYYVREKSAQKAYVTFIYNVINAAVTYDRAVFFFDGKGILTEHSYSKETIARAAQ
jgi:hypothetical protein